MINSAKIAMKLNSLLPADEAPEYTEGYEGFYHLLSIQGDVEETKLHYIIRDFDKENFQNRKETMKRAVEELQNEYGQDRILLDMNDQYYNMREKIEPVIEIVNIAKQAMENLGIEPKISPSAAEPTDHSCPTWGFRRQTSLQAGKTSTANLNTSQLTTWSKP